MVAETLVVLIARLTPPDALAAKAPSNDWEIVVGRTRDRTHSVISDRIDIFYASKSTLFAALPFSWLY